MPDRSSLSCESANDHDSVVAKVGLTTVACSTGILTLIAAPFLRTFSGAPYVASSNWARLTIRRFLREEALKRRGLGDISPRLIDLGAGSGELVLDAAEEGWIAKGAELNIWLVLTARWRAWRRGLSPRATVEWRDMWTVNMNEFDAVTVFGVPSIMNRVGTKMLKEASSECIVCCNGFEIPGWEGRKSGDVWFYRVGEQRMRTSNVSRKD